MNAPVDGARLRVLVVDDNDDGIQSLAMLLRLFGHVVGTAGDGLHALEVARADDPDVVFLDIGLPRMSGYEVARRLCEHRTVKRPLLIALTGYGQDEDRRKSAEAGFDLHLLKPVDPDELRIILEKVRV